MIASNSAAFRPVNSPAGNKMAGFSQPRTKGTDAVVQPNSPTGVRIPSRSAMLRSVETSAGSSIGWRPELTRRIDHHWSSNRADNTHHADSPQHHDGRQQRAERGQEPPHPLADRAPPGDASADGSRPGAEVRSTIPGAR